MAGLVDAGCCVFVVMGPDGDVGWENAWVASAGGTLESSAFTVKLPWPPVVGVPEITPVVLSSESPGSRLPETTDQL